MNDSCGGQSKKIILVKMRSKWLVPSIPENNNITSIRYSFIRINGCFWINLMRFSTAKPDI